MNANDRIALAALCLASALVSCSSGGGNDPGDSGSGDGNASGGGDGPATPASIVVVAGDGQSASGSTRLPVAATVAVRDATLRPLARITVTFEIVQGGGSVDAATATTDESGYASTGWTTGPAPSLNHLRASVPGVAPVSFFAKAVNTSPDVTVKVTEPRDGQLVSESVTVAARVSSTYQVATVTASVDGTPVPLTFYAEWTGKLSLVGKPRGLIVLVVTATDVFGHASETVIPLIRDHPPVVTVSSPVEGSVVRGPASLVATCTDDDPAGCTWLAARIYSTKEVVANGKDSISQPLDLSALHGPVLLEITGSDSVGQLSTVQRHLYVEPSERLSVNAVLGGPPCDVLGSRVLFADRSTSPQVLKVLDTDSGTSQPLETAPYLRCKGVLTPKGAIYETEDWLREWRDGITTTLAKVYDSALPIRVAGNFALYTGFVDGGGNLVRRDLLAGASTLVPNSSHTGGWGSLNDVAANGDVVYYDEYGDIYRWKDGVTELLTGERTDDWCVRPVTDGVNVVYLFSERFGPSNGYALVVYDGVTTRTLVGGRYGLGGYAVAGGYVAYTAGDATRVQQIWRYRTGVSEQVSFFGSSSTLEVVAPDGTVVFTSGGRRYRAAPGGLPEDIGSSLGTVILRDGKFFVLLGYTVLEVGP